MPIPPLPPLRVLESDGDPNVIPVIQITVSNGTVINQGGGKIILGMGTGASGAPGASGGMAIGSGVVGGITGAVLFVDSSQNLGQDPPILFYNAASDRLGVGTSSPTHTLTVAGSSLFTSPPTVRSQVIFSTASGGDTNYWMGMVPNVNGSSDDNLYIGAGTGITTANALMTITPGGGRFIIGGDDSAPTDKFTIKSGTLGDGIRINVTTSFATGPRFRFDHRYTNVNLAAKDDSVGIISFEGMNANTGDVGWVDITGYMVGVTDGLESSKLIISTLNSGGGAEIVTFDGTSVSYMPFGTTAGNTLEQRFLELSANGTNYVGFKAADSLATSTIWTLPRTAGSGHTFLALDSAGSQLEWKVFAAGSSTTIAYVGSSIFINASTGAGGGSGTVTAGSAGNLAFYPSAGTTVDDLVIGSSNTFLGVNSAGDSNVYKVLAAGDNITLTHTNTGLTIAATTGTPVGFAIPLIVDSGGTGLTSLASGAVLVGSSTSVAHANTAFFFDITNKRVGIRTTNPQRPFHVVASSTEVAARFSNSQNSNATIELDCNTLIGLVEMTSNGEFRLRKTSAPSTIELWPNNAVALVADSNQNVMIGITSTTVRFHVVGTSRFSSAIIMDAQATLTNNAVRADRLINIVYPLSGGGNLASDRTLRIDSGATNGTMLITSAGVTGDIIWVSTGGGSGAPTDSPYLTYAPDGTLSAELVLLGGTGLTATSGASFFLSVNTNIRDKTCGFYAGGNLSTTHIAEESRVRIPFNMQAIRVDIVASTTASGSAIVIDLNQYNHLNAAGTSLFTDTASQPQIPALFAAGSSLNFSAFPTLFAGSFLGFDIDQVGSTVAGSNLTITLIARAS